MFKLIFLFLELKKLIGNWRTMTADMFIRKVLNSIECHFFIFCELLFELFKFLVDQLFDLICHESKLGLFLRNFWLYFGRLLFIE